MLCAAAAIADAITLMIFSLSPDAAAVAADAAAAFAMRYRHYAAFDAISRLPAAAFDYRREALLPPPC